MRDGLQGMNMRTEQARRHEVKRYPPVAAERRYRRFIAHVKWVMKRYGSTQRISR